MKGLVNAQMRKKTRLLLGTYLKVTMKKISHN